MNTTTLTYLALGDSYTIGEAVPLRQNFPYQTVDLLRQKGLPFAAPEIIATTGWTTGELASAIEQHQFLSKYDLVSLLIGVNNQYRGQPLEVYENDFAALLQQAIGFAANKKESVAVISIPDYGVTPFAQTRNPEKIGKEVDEFNAAATAICMQQEVSFIDITEGSREALKDPTLIAADGLHPSAKEYSKWAKKIAVWAMERI